MGDGSEYEQLAKLESYRLMCLRVASAYRTGSHDVICVLAGMMPIGIIIKEDVECFNSRGIRKTARSASMIKWQREKNNHAKGRWTHRLIPDVSRWVDKRHDEVSFHLTQTLSGHGCFRQYLHRFGHAESPEYVDVDETAEHVIFVCLLFVDARCDMMAVSRDDTTPDNWSGVCVRTRIPGRRLAVTAFRIVLELQNSSVSSNDAPIKTNH